MTEQWWAKGKKPRKIVLERNEDGRILSYRWYRDIDKVSYILFKNADNGSGRIKTLDEPVKHKTCIKYRFQSDEQKNKDVVRAANNKRTKI